MERERKRRKRRMEKCERKRKKLGERPREAEARWSGREGKWESAKKETTVHMHAVSKNRTRLPSQERKQKRNVEEGKKFVNLERSAGLKKWGIRSRARFCYISCLDPGMQWYSVTSTWRQNTPNSNDNSVSWNSDSQLVRKQTGFIWFMGEPAITDLLTTICW